MDSWDDNDWPMNIRKKDEEQKLFHKSVTSAFLLLLDCNEQPLPLDTVRELCHQPETGVAQSERPKQDHLVRDVMDEDYGQMLDVIEGLKIGLALGRDFEDEILSADTMMADLTESQVSQDDFDVPLFRLTERRSTKPS
ncbi:hypothetical protein [Telmatospirillum siberiense]|nr:hypothetical protein [Telmatospirillum siberiense]